LDVFSWFNTFGSLGASPSQREELFFLLSWEELFSFVASSAFS